MNEKETDYLKWFISNNGRHYLNCTDEFVPVYASIELDLETDTKWHKATEDEIKELGLE